MKNVEKAKDKLEDLGYEDVIVFEDFSYDSALIGVSTDNRAVYSYSKMVEWLKDHERMSDDDAVEWIDYNTIRALPYMGERHPIKYKFYSNLFKSI